MEDDWDLYAVVRGCSASATTPFSSSSSSTTSSSSAPVTSKAFGSDSPTSCFSIFSGEKNGHFLSTQDPFEGKNHEEEWRELYKPFFPKYPASELPRRPSSPVTASKARIHHKQSHGRSMTTPRTKRCLRKNQMKKVCQVASENLSSDIWAWRKYGQKPIKGSPYPRAYYRCSSSKGCLARKQVERNRSDPGMFIVTFTAEHTHPSPTHRNSLAGSTFQKPESSPEPGKFESGGPDFPSSPSSKYGVAPPSSTAVSKEEIENPNDEDDFGVSEVVFDEDFVVRFKELDRPATGDSLYEDSPPSSGSPWTEWS